MKNKSSSIPLDFDLAAGELEVFLADRWIGCIVDIRSRVTPAWPAKKQAGV